MDQLPNAPPTPKPGHWLNRTVVGAGVTSLLADAGYEMANAALPGFLRGLAAGSAPLALGLIEGVADALSNFAKLGAGWVGDRVGRKKPLVVFGYALTGVSHALWAVAASWHLVFAGKLLGWFGKGVRGPLRNAILADAVAPSDRGKAFGLHRSADTIGAVLGPLAGMALLAWLAPRWSEGSTEPYRLLFWLTLVPGLGAALAFAVMVREGAGTGAVARRFGAALRELPRPFRRYLIGVGVFGLGDFSRTFLILAAADLLRPQYGPVAAVWAVGLYAWHNTVQALTAFPVGALSDRLGRRGLLALGYLVGAGVAAALAAVTSHGEASLALLMAILAMSGLYIGVEEALESAMTADLVPDSTLRGTAFGVLGAVNGLGDLVASLVVGLLWTAYGPPAACYYAAVMMALGAVLVRTAK
jgi:MFS family permease